MNFIDLKSTNDHGILIWGALKLFSLQWFTPATCIFQMSLSAIQSVLEDDLSGTVMPLYDFVYHSGRDHCNNHGDGVILQAPIDPAEPVNSSFISPDTLQPSTYVPVNENATDDPHSISNPGYINNDNFQAHSVTSEMPHNAYPDPLLIELERIEMMNEEAFKIHEKKV